MPKILSDERDMTKFKLGERIRWMRKNEPDALREFLMTLNEKEAQEILYDMEIHARENQWVDLSDGFPVTLALAARGWGKGWVAASTLKRAVEKHGVTQVTWLAQTARDFRSNLAPSIIDMYPADHPNKPYWSPSKASVIWPNGAIAVCIPSSEPDKIRGLNNEMILGDEAAFWRAPGGGDGTEIFTQAMLTLRKEPSKMIITTSPLNTPLIVNLVEKAQEEDNNYVKMIRGTTYENLENLSKAFQETVIQQYEGTHVGRQELMGELILTNDHSLFQYETVQKNTIDENELPRLVEVCLGVDPAVLAKKSSSKGRKPDATGIILSGIDENSILYTLNGWTGSYSTEKWVDKVCEIYDRYSSLYKFTIAVEINVLGEELIRMAFDKAGRSDVARVLKPIYATASKLQRASPYSLMAEQGRIKFVDRPYLKDLRLELTTYDGTGPSPNNFDAAVWSWSNLQPIKKQFTKSYELLI